MALAAGFGVPALFRAVLTLAVLTLEVLVSVRNAIGGTDLNKLHEAVKREFLTLDEQEKSFRSVLAKMESGFIHQFMRFQHD